ncbi:hypothetical protein [uncultured Sphingomonas sp.]|uniref:hypothetical protein n=1 Tax=uncultured Sphingomonas sp. TaxID=158754 RepID=UPI00262B3C6D|nr:hypothetical protein [uncultured Sphingomonas sp.]
MKRMSLYLALAATAALAAATSAEAQAVPTCSALSLYANAARTGLCRSLSPTTQNLWVCELSGANPDVHITFNAGNALHITVRQAPQPGGCDQHTNFTGNYPGGLALAGGGAPICNVNIRNYRDRLNAVQQLQAVHGQTLVQAAALAAVAASRLTPAVAQTYINTAANQHCP